MSIEECVSLSPSAIDVNRRSVCPLWIAAYEDSPSDNCQLGIAEAVMPQEKGMKAIDYSIRACQHDADTCCLY